MESASFGRRSEVFAFDFSPSSSGLVLSLTSLARDKADCFPWRFSCVLRHENVWRKCRVGVAKKWRRIWRRLANARHRQISPSFVVFRPVSPCFALFRHFSPHFFVRIRPVSPPFAMFFAISRHFFAVSFLSFSPFFRPLLRVCSVGFSPHFRHAC